MKSNRRLDADAMKKIARKTNDDDDDDGVMMAVAMVSEKEICELVSVWCG